MNLVIDARTVRPGRSGVGNYTESLVRALGGTRPVRALVLDPAAFGPVPPAGVELIPVATDYQRHPAGEWWENVTLPRLLARLGADVFWGPAFLIPWVPVRARAVATIHDLTAFTHPGCYPPRFAAYMRFAIRMAASRADGLVCVSHHVAGEVARLFPAAAGRIRMVHSAADADFTPSRPPLPGSPSPSPSPVPSPVHPRPYILAVGARDPRKNTALLLEAYARLRAAWPGSAGVDLVLTGGWDGPAAPGVIALPRVPRETLIELYRQAAVFALPSLGEGFGLPVLEAMACGCPVVSSHAPALPEVAGDAALYFDPADADSLAAALRRVLEDPAKAAAMRGAGLARAAGFGWDKAAAEMWDFFEELASRPGGPPHLSRGRKPPGTWQNPARAEGPPHDPTEFDAGKTRS